MRVLIWNIKKYLLVPIVKNTYSRIGPKQWQDWYRQIKATARIAQTLKDQGNELTIVILSNFQPAGKPSEIEIYTKTLQEIDSQLDIRSFRETNSTFEQVEQSFKLSRDMDASLIFVSTWMQFPRVVYLAHRRPAKHYGVFGIPQPFFAFIDPVCIIFETILDILGLSSVVRRISIRQREKGKIL